MGGTKCHLSLSPRYFSGDKAGPPGSDIFFIIGGRQAQMAAALDFMLARRRGMRFRRIRSARARDAGDAPGATMLFAPRATKG